MFTKTKVSQSMLDAVNKVLEENKRLINDAEIDETGFHKAAHAAKKSGQTHFEFQGKKYPVTAKSHAEAIEMDEATSEKVPTSTGMKVYGHRYGNAAKAHRDQTKHSVDDVKEPKKKDIDKEKDAHLYVKDTGQHRNYKVHAGKYFSNMDDNKPTKGKEEPRYKNEEVKVNEEGDCVTKPEAKDIAKKEVKGHEKKMHKEGYSFKDKLVETLRRSDVPAYLRKAKGEKPLTPDEVKAPKKDTISHSDNLAKARNEEVESLEEKNWIAGAIKKPGAETAAAHKAGMSVQAYAHKHAHDSGKEGKRARLAITLKKLHKEDIEEVELDEMINEVLSKDATAGDWIHDFVHSKNPKFAGKSKAERKKMALGAYYGKQNEEMVNEAEVVTSPANTTEVTTDMLKGRVKGGKANSFKSFKLQLKTDGEMKAPEIEKGEDTREKQKISTNPGPVDIKLDDKLTGPTPYTHFSDEQHITHEEVKPVLKHIRDKEETKHDKEIDDFKKKVVQEGKMKAMATDKDEDERLGSWHKETPWKVSKGTVTDKSGAKHTPMSRAKDLARQAFKKIKNETMMGKAGTTSESKKKW